jgi:hypothetical protein
MKNRIVVGELLQPISVCAEKLQRKNMFPIGEIIPLPKNTVKIHRC